MTSAQHRTGTRSPRRRSRRADRPKAQAGFTLLELMVALIAGLIAITAIYFVSAGSTRHFHEQQRVAQTQMSVRMAMEQLRRDIARAGFHGTPNSQVEQRCAAPPQEIQAVEFLDNQDTAALPNAAENLVTADRIRLVGNYMTGGAYFARGLNSVGSAIFLQTDWQGFRRDFGIVGSTFNATTFQEVFLPGRMLHIRTLENNHFFVTITGVNAASQSISFQPGLGVGGNCVGGLAAGAVVAPLARIEYAVVDPRVDANLSNLVSPAPAALRDAKGLIPAVLVRRELNFNNDNPIAGSERIVLEYAANIDFQFMFDDQVTVGGPPNLVRRFGQAAQDELDIRPHHLRTVFASLSARGAAQDPRFIWVARGAGDPLTRYRANAALPGAARVRTLRTEIALPNLTSRVIRP